MKTRKTKKRNIIRRAVAFLLCMTMVLGLGMQDVIEQVYAEGLSAVSEQSADVPETQEVKSEEVTAPEEETEPEDSGDTTGSDETAPTTPEEEPTDPVENTEPTDPANPADTDVTTLPTDPADPTAPPTDPAVPVDPSAPADGTENTDPVDPETPVNPDGSNGSESSDETTSGEDTDTEGEGTPSEGGEELPVEEKPVSELTYAAEDGSFSVKAAAVSEDVDLSGIEIHASQVQKDGEEYAAAEELVAAALDAESRQIEELQAYDIWFTYTESGETADLSGQAQISLEYTAPEFPEGTDAQLEVFCLNGGAAEAVDGTDALAAGCELYALAWAVPAESTDIWEWTDDQVIIKASADKGVLPEGAEISVTPIVKTEEEELANLSEEERAEAEAINEQYAQTEEKLTEDLEVQAAEKAAALPAAADAEVADAASASEETADASGAKTLEGFLAYDICFLVNGEEVEPADGEVNVSIEFNEAVIPEGVSEDAEVSVAHLKEEKNENGEDEIVVEDLTSAETTIVETTDKAEVKKVELVTESFSTFTIYWGARYDAEVTVKRVDENGNEIVRHTNGQNVSVESGDWVTLEEHAYDIKVDNYKYVRSYILINDEEVEIEQLMAQRGYYGRYSYYYKTDESAEQEKWDSYNRIVYMEYEDYPKDDEPTPVDTVDSYADGIKMRMINFDGAAFDGATYGTTQLDKNGVKQGILSDQLYASDGSVDKNGYPKFADTIKGAESDGPYDDNKLNISAARDMQTLFEDAVNANHLFIQDTYDTTGYYYYNSGENAATFNGDRNSGVKDFKVYEQLMTPHEDRAFFYQRGNFLPYDTFNRMNASKYRNLYDEMGNLLSDDDPRKGEYLYLPDEGSGNAEYEFGMELTADFLQTKNGEYNGQDIVYEFTGDDDLWVYVDGVLLLDLGGCHDARSGYINFSTGEIGVQVVGEVKNNNIQAGYSLENGWLKTTIRARFEQVLGQEAADKCLIQNEEGNWIFPNYSTHTFRMWYMERGQGASNLRIKFNLPVIPDGEIQIGKELSVETDPVKYGDVEFGFELYVQKYTENGDGNPVVADPEAYEKVTPELMETHGYKAVYDKTERDIEIEDDGIFYLKPGERVNFSGIPDTIKYYVREVDIKSEEYDQVDFNGTPAIEEEDEDGGTIGSGKAYKTSEAAVNDRYAVIFTNSCSAQNMRTLSIKKEMQEGQTAENEYFTVEVKLEGSDGKLQLFSGGYALLNENNQYIDEAGNIQDDEDRLQTTDGKIRLKAGWTINIYSILSETRFEVNEILSDEQELLFANPVYQVCTDGTDRFQPENHGEIELGHNAEVVVTNSYKSVLTVQKDWKVSNHRPIPDTIYVGLYKIESGEQTPTNQVISLTSAQGWKGTFIGLEDGVYAVKELTEVSSGSGEFQYNNKYYNGVNSGESILFNGLRFNVSYDHESVEIGSAGAPSITITNKMDWKIRKVSESNPDNFLEGAKFKLSNSANEVVSYAVSGSDGYLTWYVDAEMTEQFDLSSLVDGDYTLEEYMAPNNCVLNKEKWTIKMKNGIANLITTDSYGGTNPDVVPEKVDGTLVYQYENALVYELPSTGGPGIYLYMLGGVALMMAGTLLVYKKRKEEVLRS